MQMQASPSSDPDASCQPYDIPNRIALGSYVIDEERVTGYSPGGPDVVRAVLVYRFDGDLISEILILS